MYTDGYLPEPGAVTDQPNNLMLAIQDISLSRGYLDNQDAERDREGGHDPSPREGFKSVTRKE